MKGDSMCTGWAVMSFRRLKKPVCTAENHGLQTGYYQYNNFFGAAARTGCPMLQPAHGAYSTLFEVCFAFSKDSTGKGDLNGFLRLTKRILKARGSTVS